MEIHTNYLLPIMEKHSVKNTGVEPCLYDIKSNIKNYTLQRDADLITIDKLILHFNENVSDDEINNIINEMKSIKLNKKIMIQSGDVVLANLKLSFLLSLSEPIICSYGGTKVLKINLYLDYMIPDFKLIALQYDSITIKILNYDSIVNHCKHIYISTKLIYFEGHDRCEMACSNNEKVVYNIDYIKVKTNETLESNIRFEGKGMSAGFFIEANIDDLEDIEITLNGHTRFKYQSFLFDEYCKKFGTTMLYIPFNPMSLNHFMDPLHQYLSGICNLSKFEFSDIITKWKKPQPIN